MVGGAGPLWVGAVGLNLAAVAFCAAYSFGSEVALNRVKSTDDVFQSVTVWALHFFWGCGAPIAVLWIYSAITQVHGDSDDAQEGLRGLASSVLLGLSAILLNWFALALRMAAIRDMTIGSGKEGYDRRVETFVLGSFFSEKDSEQKEEQKKEELLKKEEQKPAFRLTTTGVYSRMRHAGFSAHIIQQVANAALVCSAWVRLGNPPADSVLLIPMLVLLAQFQLSYTIFNGACASEEAVLKEVCDSYDSYAGSVPRRYFFEGIRSVAEARAALGFLWELHRGFVDSSWASATAAAQRVRHGSGSARQMFCRLVGILQGMPLAYVDPLREPELVDQLLLSTGNKGTMLELLSACPAWQPILSLESVDHVHAAALRSHLVKVMGLLQLDDRVDGVVDRCLTAFRTRVEAKRQDKADEKSDAPLVGFLELERMVFDVFYMLLTDALPHDAEFQVALEAVETWKGAIALKQPANEEAKARLLRHMQSVVYHYSPFLGRGEERPKGPEILEDRPRERPDTSGENFVFDVDNIEHMSCIMQPLMVSPCINFCDIFASIKRILDKHPQWIAKAAESKQVADMVLLETIRTQHPFPILERTLEKPVTVDSASLTGSQKSAATGNHDPYIRTIPAGTHVFIEYDQAPFGSCPNTDFDPERWREYVLLGKNYPACPIGKCAFRGVPFGNGSRKCKGQALARAILRPVLSFVCAEFPLGAPQKFPSQKQTSWADFQPSHGHRLSGRTNDAADEEDLGFVVGTLASILWQSLCVGVRRRLGFTVM